MNPPHQQSNLCLHIFSEVLIEENTPNILFYDNHPWKEGRGEAEDFLGVFFATLSL